MNFLEIDIDPSSTWPEKLIIKSFSLRTGAPIYVGRVSPKNPGGSKDASFFVASNGGISQKNTMG